MSSERRRRSNRLIASPWLNKGTKRPPCYVDLVSEEENTTAAEEVITLTRNVRWGAGLGSAKVMKGRSDGFGGEDKKVTDGSTEETKNRGEDWSDDDDFVTPAERFIEHTDVMQGRVTGCKRKIGSAIQNISTTEKGTSSHQSNEAAHIRNIRMTSRTKDGTTKETVARNGLRKRRVSQEKGPSASCSTRAQDACSAGKKTQRPKSGVVVQVKGKGRSTIGRVSEQVKKVRTYDNYIQKKFSPAILRDVLENLSREQFDWAVSTGFGDILNFRMEHYPHRLGYNVVDAFVEDRCSLLVKAGEIKITEEIVQQTIGLPRGTEKVIYNSAKGAFDIWGKQFPGVQTCKVTPIMVREKMLSTQEADKPFKLNFLVMFYNFFIEGHQSRYLLRDIVRFSGDIDDCGKYNWCGLLIDKLKFTHRYWSEDKKRNFSGPLPFLIYLYVSRVVNDITTRVPLKTPAYYGWSDMLLKERQKHEMKNNCFGEGNILEVMTEIIKNGKSEIKTMGKPVEMVNFDLNKDDLVEDVVEGQDDSVGDKMLGCEQEVENIPEGIVTTDTRNLPMEMDTMQPQGDMQEDIAPDSEDSFMAEVCMGANSIDNSILQEENRPVQDSIVVEQDKESGKREVCDLQDKFVQNRAVDMNELKGQGDHVTEGGTQIRVGEEIDRHFAEEPFVERFVNSLNQLDLMYKKCVTECVTTFALYPENERLATLKDEFPLFFKLFEETSPMTKSLCSVGETRNKIADTEQNSPRCVPSFSLGLSQLTPKKLDDEMEGIMCADTNIKIEIETKGQVGQVMRDRPRRGVNLAQVCRSPFVSRIVDVNAHKISTKEKNAWDWVMQTGRDIQEYLFEWNGRYCTRAHFQSLEDSKMVETTLIDTWSYVLNENEILRSDNSPLRLFLTTETTYGPLQLPDVSTDPLSRYCAFDDHLELALVMVNEVHNKHYDVNDFDMFVFPIFSGAHHYVIVYDVRKPRCELLDNRVQTASFDETYGDLPGRLHECFCQFLSFYNLPKYTQIQKLVPVVVHTVWQTTENNVDCGIFAMRHMETYMGNVHLWRTGLRTERDNQKSILNKLRVIYCHLMLTWARNQRRKLVLEGMKRTGKNRKSN